MTLSPTSTFITGTGAAQICIGGEPADATVAVSSTHVVVTARDAFGCYTKEGTLVPPGPGMEARPYTVEDFFGTQKITVPPSPTNTPAKDGRVVFDQHRQRFFMVFQGEQEPPILYLAASKSDDPTDGWWVYADNVYKVETVKPDINGQDYDWLGINATHLLVANQMARNSGTPFTKTWKNVETLCRYLLYDADALAGGDQNYLRTELTFPLDPSAMPCVHESPTADSFWVSRNNGTSVTVWGARNGVVAMHDATVQTTTSPLLGPQPNVGVGKGVSYGNFGRTPQNAVYRDGHIYCVSNVGYTWDGQANPNNAVHLLGIDVTNFFAASNPGITVEIDRLLGGETQSDPVGETFDYGWPAVSTNARGDIVVGCVRSNGTTLPQFWVFVRFAGDTDFSASIPLSSSITTFQDYHMAGAGYDRSTGGVFVAQQTNETPGVAFQIRVASILGGQPNWRWCSACQGLYYLGNGTPGNCLVNGTHVFTQSGNYALHAAGNGPPGQDNWRWCNKCDGLIFGGSTGIPNCPAGGSHDYDGSGDYELVQVASSPSGNSQGLPPQMQDNWSWCRKCQTLYFSGNLAATTCIYGESHDNTGSSNYALETIPNPP